MKNISSSTILTVFLLLSFFSSGFYLISTRNSKQFFKEGVKVGILLDQAQVRFADPEKFFDYVMANDYEPRTKEEIMELAVRFDFEDRAERLGYNENWEDEKARRVRVEAEKKAKKVPEASKSPEKDMSKLEDEPNTDAGSRGDTP